MNGNGDHAKEARLDRFLTRFSEEQPFALLILKGHLLLEELLEEVIISACRDRQSVYEARLSFHSKAKLAQAIDGHPSPVWRCIEKLNSVRNELAHGRDSSMLEKKIDELISCTRQFYPSNRWGDERSFDLELSVIILHGAMSRVAAEYARM